MVRMPFKFKILVHQRLALSEAIYSQLEAIASSSEMEEFQSQLQIKSLS
jgi:hypothetical protein